MAQSRLKTPRRSYFPLLAGLLALFLQAVAPALPPAAMAGAMDLAAATPEEAASFAATCLGLGRPDMGTQDTGDHQAKCPVCLSLAQAQGFAPPQAQLVAVIAWDRIPSPFVADAAPATIVTSAFASRAPPAA